LFTLSTTVFEVLWEALRLPPMPAAVAVAQHGATLDERARIEAAALDEAGRLGLDEPPVPGLLELLARHSRAASLRELAGRRRRAYAAAHERRGALAVVERDRVSIGPVAGDHVVTELLALLAPLPAGPGRAVTLPATAFRAGLAAYADGRDSTAARGVLAAAGVSGKDIERLLTIGRESVGSGSIGVHAGEPGGAALVGSLGYVDIARGRYAIVRGTDHAARPHVSLVPVDHDGLRARLHVLLAGARG
jgi:hypothetical protein